MPEVDINYWAVLVAAVANMVIGSLWYAPFAFGNTWMRLLGLRKEEIKGAGKAMTVAAVAALVTAYVMAHMVDYTQANTWQEGAQAGFWLWLGFVATIGAVGTVFANRKWALYAIDMGNHLLTLLVMGVILALWV